MRDIPNIPFKLNPLYLREGESYEPPAGTPIIRPYRDLMQFFPAPSPAPYEWLRKYRERIDRLGIGVASVFQVAAIRDGTYAVMPEEMKATYLSCVVTDANLHEVSPGRFEWDAICVVVRYHVLVAVQLRIEPATNVFEIPRAHL